MQSQMGLAAFGFTAFFGLAAGFFLGLTTSPILNDPEAPVPFDCFKTKGGTTFGCHVKIACAKRNYLLVCDKLT
jgi:hypothetical protein